MGGWVVPVAKSCHFVVLLAKLQDFKQSRNSQVGPSVAIMHQEVLELSKVNKEKFVERIHLVN